MKSFSFIVKYILTPAGTVIGLIYAFDVYVIERANTVVKPVEVKVHAMEKNVEEITIRTRNIEKILMERR